MHSPVAESVLHILRIRTGFQQHGGVRLPEAVKITIDAELLLDHGDRVLHRVRPDIGPVLAAADKVDPVIRITRALDQVPPLIDMILGIVRAVDEAGAALHRVGPAQQAEQLGADPDRADAVVFRSGEEHRLKGRGMATRRRSSTTLLVLDLTVHGDRAGIEVDVVPGQAESLTLPEPGPVTEHQRKMGRMPLREALHDPLPGRTVDIAVRVPARRLIGHRTGRRQTCILRGVVFDVLHADGPVHGSGEPALHVGECVAGESLVEKIVEIFLDDLR